MDPSIFLYKDDKCNVDIILHLKRLNEHIFINNRWWITFEKLLMRYTQKNSLAKAAIFLRNNKGEW